MAKQTQRHFPKAQQLPRQAWADNVRIADNSLCNCDTGMSAQRVQSR
jgi:hypothetical protein